MSQTELHIRISASGVTAVDWGGADIPFSNSDELDLEQQIAKIFHKVLNMRLASDEVSILGKDDFVVLGKMLFKLLFNQVGIKNIFNQLYIEAANSNDTRCRIILEFEKDAYELANLPWEYLYYEDKKTFIAAHPKKCFDLIRMLPSDPEDFADYPQLAEHAIEPPVNLLLITSNPDGQYHVPDMINVAAYFEALSIEHSSLINIKTIAQPNSQNFREQLFALTHADDGFIPHIIHFVGHGRLSGDNGQLAFVKKDDYDNYTEEWISDEEFAGYIEELDTTPQLIFLHVCDGAKIGDYQKDKGLALQLGIRRIPTIVAMQNPVTSWIATAFVKQLYDNFLRGDDLTTAITKGRFFLGRELRDPTGKKYENYNHKAFGSPVVFTCTKQPLILVSPEEEAITTIPVVPEFKTCVNHPEQKFPVAFNLCPMCGSELIAGIQKSMEPTIEANRSADAGSDAFDKDQKKTAPQNPTDATAKRH